MGAMNPEGLQERISPRAAARLLRLIFPIIGLVLGFKTLSDPDLGWHLATGLWILDHHQTPIVDPFGVGKSFYLAYSWLFDVVTALVFSFGGWVALQISQALLIALAVYVLVGLVQCASAYQKSKDIRITLLSETLSVALTVPLIASVWNLRPQLLSVIFFAWALQCVIRRRFSIIRAALLTVVWANIHVYWIVAPGVWLLFSTVQSSTKTIRNLLLQVVIFLALISLGLLNPYGAALFTGMWEYAFQHDAGYKLIREFQHLSSDAGYAPYLFALVVLLLISKARSVPNGDRLAWGVLCAGLAIGAVLQIKYLALFAVAAAPLLASVVFPSHLRDRLMQESSTNQESSAMARRLLPFTAILFFIVLGLTWDSEPALSKETSELLTASSSLASQCAQRSRSIVNHFDDGGWLSFAFYQRYRESGDECRTAIDGRTLVMGQMRLKEFDQFRRGEGECEFVLHSGGEVAIFAQPLKGIRPEAIDRCFATWKREPSPESWMMLSKE